MLYMNIRRVMNLRGIVAHFSYLQKNGFIHSTAYKFANNDVSRIDFSKLERLCLLLNCTPNDLFEWQPQENQTVTENTALKSLIRDKAALEVSQIVKDLPLEKLEKVKDLLAQLKDEE